MKKPLLLSFCLYVSCTVGIAQTIEPNMKWGKPTQQELSMTTYEADPDADAVKLYQKVDVNYDIVNGGFKVFYRVKCRIKVLKPEGKEYGDVSIVFWNNEKNHHYKETVPSVKGTSYNMENGTVTKSKLESSMIHEIRLDKEQKQIKFSMPQVRVGTVIEYEFRIESEIYYDLRDWYAQSNIPVLYTEYDVSIPDWFDFSIEETGMHKLERKTGGSSLNFVNDVIATKEYTFIGRDLPALKDDDFVWHATDYGSKVTHELRNISVPGAVYRDYSTKWEDIDGILAGDDDFGGRLKKSSPLKEELLGSSIPSIADKKARALAVFQLLKEKVRWNGDYAFEAKSASKLLKEGTGTNADINFLYINMLRDVGIEAMPVMLRLRSNGRLPMTHASLKYLNTFVVGIQDTDSTLCYIDASVEANSLNILPAVLLAERARVFSPKGQGFWVNLQQSAIGEEKMAVQGTLDTNGLFTGKCNTVYTDEKAALLAKRWREAKDSVELIHQMESEDGIKITEYQKSPFPGNVFTVRESMGITKQFDATDNQIYLNPLVMIPVKENPFKAEKRELPIEFPYQQQKTLNVIITLPEGYQVEDMPAPIVMKFDGITARIVCSLRDKFLSVQYRFTISRTFYSQSEYQDLRSFFDKLVESCNQIVTVKKG